MFSGFPIKLRCYFDLLTTGEQVRYGHPCHTCHLSQIEQTHQFFKESHREVGIFQAVYCQSPSCELILSLEFTDDRMVHILFLFAEEVSRHCIERERVKFMFTEDHLKHIELDSSLHVYILSFSSSQCLRRELISLHFRLNTINSAKHGVFVHMECYSSTYDIVKVEVNYVVSSDYVGVNFYKEVTPFLQ